MSVYVNFSDITATISKVVACINISELLAIMDNFFKDIGVEKYNYVHTDEKCQKQHFLFHNNYTPSWIQKYIARNYTKVDPAVFSGKLHNVLTTWKEACVNKVESIYLSKALRDLLYDMIDGVKVEGIANGVIIPIVSEAYRQHGFYLAFSDDTKIYDTNIKYILGTICIMFNNKFLEFERQKLIESSKAYSAFSTKSDYKIPLTEREIELVRLIYYGKERGDIAQIMNVSMNTIDTMTKRIFLKMRVNSKVQLIAKVIMKKWHYVLF